MALPIEPNLLLTLALLLKTKSVTATAAALGVSQPSVSRALAQLRDVMKDPLLIRAGNGMARTCRGDELVDRLAGWMAMTSALLEDEAFEPRRIQRRFRVASTDFGVLSVLSPALPGIYAQAPGIAIDIVPLTRATHRALADSDIDLAISGLDHDPTQLHRLMLFKDEFACVMDRSHPLADGSEAPVPLDQFLAHPHLGLTVSDAEIDRVTIALGPAGKGRRIAASLPYFAMAPDLLRTAGLMMTVPRRAATRFCHTHDLAARPAPTQIGKLEYWVLWHERSHRDPASRWLREQLAATCNAENE